MNPLRILYPERAPATPTAVEQQDDGEARARTSPSSEHARLTAGTGDLWRQFATLAAGATP